MLFKIMDKGVVMIEQLQLPLRDPVDPPSRPGVNKFEIFVDNITKRLIAVNPNVDPFGLFVPLKKWCEARKIPEVDWVPRFDFFDKVVGSKHRTIGAPNISAAMLHRLFRRWLQKECLQHEELKRFVMPRSATAFVYGSSPLQNVWRHRLGRHFYILDLKDAYRNVDVVLLGLIITAILKYDAYREDLGDFLHASSFGKCDEAVLRKVRTDPLYVRVARFVNTFCTDASGRGLITGGPASPFLFNLFYEAVLDPALRRTCGQQDIIYSRYADDLVFSHPTRPIFPVIRKKIRSVIHGLGTVNHCKSRVLDRAKGVVFITGFGLGEGREIVFPQKKRTKLRGMLRTAFRRQEEVNVAVICGHIAHFREYLRRREEPTAQDRRLLDLIFLFEKLLI